jgi:cytosine/adenosine deaminase-related metal-dependent hydrolase
VHPELLKRITMLAVRQQLPIAMHLAESREELQLLRENAGPFRELLEARSMWDSQVYASGYEPLDLLKVLAHAPRALVVHGNYLAHQEIEFIADRRGQMSIVYCPRTHAYFGHAAYPLSKMLDAGVQLAVGTDSRASNPDLSLLSELRFMAQTYQDVAPQQILSLGTLGGAEALGLADLVGSLVPGKLANLTAIECEHFRQSPLAAVLFGAAMPQQTWLRGKMIVNLSQ